MGIVSEWELSDEELAALDPFEVRPTQEEQAALAAAQTPPEPPADPVQQDEDEEKKRAEHEAAEEKRRAEWEVAQAAKKAAMQEKLDALAAMSDSAVMNAAMERAGAETERLTRRNMKLCVMELIQTKCLEDASFARLVMHPRKSMMHCFWYINRKAQEYARQEMEEQQRKPEQGIYGTDVPDELVYQWAEEYFRDAAAKEDEEKEEAFIPHPYKGKSSPKPKKAKAVKPKEKKAPAPKPEQEQLSFEAQLTLGDFEQEAMTA